MAEPFSPEVVQTVLEEKVKGVFQYRHGYVRYDEYWLPVDASEQLQKLIVQAFKWGLEAGCSK